MALVVADRVQETTTTTGTGTYTLAGAKDGFQSFAAVGDGNTTYYACTDGTDYEVGIGTYTATGTTLARTTIIESSNSDLAVSWGAGEKDIFVTLPASKATVLDASGNATFTGDVTFEGATSGRNIVFDRSDNALEFVNDYVKAKFGSGSQMELYYSVSEGANIRAIVGSTGYPLSLWGSDVRIKDQNGNTIFRSDGASAELYEDGSKKLETTSAGINVTGNITVSGTVDGVDIATNIPSTLGTAGQVLTVNAGATAGEWADAGGNLELYAENPSTPTAPSATGTNAVAIGSGAVASALHAYAIGEDTDATVERSVALGYLAQTGGSGGQGVAIGNSMAFGTQSFAVNISNNTTTYGATGTNSIAIGRLTKASGTDSVSIGDNNVVSNTDAIALGNTNTVSGSTGIAIGTNHTVSGTLAASIGGSSSTATQTYAMTFGPYAKAAVQNAFIFGSKGWFSAGSAQGGIYILYADTTDATPEVLTTTNSTAGTTNQIVAASDTCITFDGTITAMQNGAQAYASWKIEGLLVNDGGTTTLANSATTVIQNLSGWGMALSADNTNNALAITVTGEAAHNIRWVANIRTTEVTYA